MWLAVWLLGCADEKEPVVDDDGDGANAKVDCDDGDETIFPGAEEVPYDGIDQDCADGDLLDVDGDGAIEDDDCDDADPQRYPDNVETPYDGIDQDCEKGDLVDVDEDDHPNGEDCDDRDPRIHPNAIDDVGDDVDRNCDGIDGMDEDLDEWASVSSGGPDCDDENPSINPSVDEIWYDNVDQDCDQGCDFDQDGDQAVRNGADVTPGAPCSFGGAAELDCDDLDSSASTTELLSTLPVVGALTVPLGAEITATLSFIEPSASISLVDGGGAPVPGTSTSSGTVITFVPDAPLDEATLYSAEIDWSCGPRTLIFTTVTTVAPADLVGRVWNLDLLSGTVVSPPGLGGLFGGLTTTVMLTVAGEQAGEVDFRAAQATAGVQDLCTPTYDADATPFDQNPRFTLGPMDVPFVVGGIPGVLNDATFSGFILADGSAITEARLIGELDTRPLVPLIGGGPPQAVCQLLNGIGPPCVQCSDGAGQYCTVVELTNLTLPELVGASVEERTDADIAADAFCP